MTSGDRQSLGVILEEKAAEALKFYTANYDTLVWQGLQPGNRLPKLGSKPQICRFCDRTRHEVTFRKKAHAVPELIGNKTLVTLYECDDCNDRFSSFEDDFAKMTLGDRSVSRTRGKKSVPTLTATGKKSRIEHAPAGLVMKQYVDEGFISIDEQASQLKISYETQPFRPLGAYKCLAKMAYTLLPEVELPHFPELKAWLREKDVTTKKVYGDGNHLCSMSFVPGPKPFPCPIVALLRRKTTVAAPYAMFFVAFANWTYQIFVPCPRQDNALAGKNIQIYLYPHFYQLQPWRALGAVQVKNTDLSDPERRAEPKKINLHFDSMTSADSNRQA